jgi:hypothetical protein
MSTVTYAVKNLKTGNEVGQIEARYDSSFPGVYNLDGVPCSSVFVGMDSFGAVPRYVLQRFLSSDNINEVNRAIVGCGLFLSVRYAS